MRKKNLTTITTLIYLFSICMVVRTAVNCEEISDSFIDGMWQYLDANNYENLIENGTCSEEIIDPTKLHDIIGDSRTVRREKRQVHTGSSSSSSSLVNLCAVNRQRNATATTSNIIDPTSVWASSDFCELVLYGNYVDKTLFIADVLNGDETVPMVKRPSGWGKTVNLNMMKRFLEHRLDEHGNRVPPSNDSVAYKLFAGGEIRVPIRNEEKNEIVVRLKPLKIAELTNLTDEYFGRWPVIYVTYKDIIGRSYREIEAKTRKLMAELYRSHYYMRDWIEDEEKRGKFDRFVNGTAAYEDMEKSIFFLSELMHKRYEEKVYILIDDHDTPVYQFYLHVNETLKLDQNVSTSVQDSRQYVEFLNLFGNIMITGLRRTHHIAQGVVTGFAASNLFDFTVLDEEISQYFGFLPEEVDQLLLLQQQQQSTIAANSAVPSIDKAAMKKWYYGYSFGVAEEYFYIPYSTVRYLKTGRLEYYALNSRNTTVLDYYTMQDWFQPTMQRILAGNRLNQVIEGIHGFPNIDVDKRYVNLLLFHGFLNPVWFKYYKADLEVCNEEMKRYYETRIETWLHRKLRANGTANANANANEYANALLMSNLDQFREKLNASIRRYLPEFPEEGDDIVRLYNVVLKSFLKSPFSNVWNVQINSSNESRPVLVIEPTADKYDTAAVLTFVSVTNDDTDILSKLKDGLNSITVASDGRNNKHYESRLKKNHRLKKMIRLCLAFNKYLDVHVIHETEELNR